MRSRALSWMAIMVAFLVFPGTVEAVQDTLHWVVDGHTAHDQSTAHHADGPEDDEHGCSSSYHVCSCCTSVPIAPCTVVIDGGTPAPQPIALSSRLESPTPSGHLDRLFRPPSV